MTVCIVVADPIPPRVCDWFVLVRVHDKLGCRLHILRIHARRRASTLNQARNDAHTSV